MTTTHMIKVTLQGLSHPALAPRHPLLLDRIRRSKRQNLGLKTRVVLMHSVLSSTQPVRISLGIGRTSDMGLCPGQTAVPIGVSLRNAYT